MEPGIIYEDENILVVDKPSGFTVNRADTTKGEQTLQDWLEAKKGLNPSRGLTPKEGETDFYKRAGIVHRLDKETSGVLIVAKDPSAFEHLQKQFKERTVKKTYLAFVHGSVVPQHGEIRVPVGRLPWNRKRFGVVAGGRDAVTRYQVISNFKSDSIGLKFQISNEQFTLLELYPETGRTHQIRVHLKYAGYPIFSDPLYGGRKQARNDRKILPRLFLHASRISFLHPKTGERMELESPLPKELSILGVKPL